MVKKKVTKKVEKKPVKKVVKKIEKKVVKPKPVKKEVKVKKKVEMKPKKKVVLKEKTKPVSKKKEVKEKKTSAKIVAKPEKSVKQAPEPVKKTHLKKYSAKELEYFRKIIIDKKNEIIDDLQSLREQMLDPTTGEYINENSPYSLHMAEQGTDAMEREKTFLYAQRENKFLGYLEDALKRIDAGTYGLCLECIDEPQHLCPTCPLIPKERLIAVPHSQLCLPIKMRQEKKKNQ